jgi:hypothetical protein
MFRLEMKTDNAAFEEWAAPMEIARILRDVANRLEDDQLIGPCRDINGNNVGQYRYRR